MGSCFGVSRTTSLTRVLFFSSLAIVRYIVLDSHAAMGNWRFAIQFNICRRRTIAITIQHIIATNAIATATATAFTTPSRKKNTRPIRFVPFMNLITNFQFGSIYSNPAVGFIRRFELR